MWTVMSVNWSSSSHPNFVILATNSQTKLHTDLGTVENFVAKKEKPMFPSFYYLNVQKKEGV